MKSGYVKTSPCFFRLIKLALAIFIGCVIALAAVIPAPLQGPADIGRPPNPAKSAWFLLWIQELVSYSVYLVYPALLVALLFLFLPWLPGTLRAWKAQWLPPDQRLVNILTIAACVAIVGLTVIALFFRGENWALLMP